MKSVRLPIWLKPNKRKIFLSITQSAVLCAVLFSILWYQKQYKLASASKKLKQFKVLILYYSGNPTSQVKKAVPNLSEDIDAMSSPTSKYNNTAFVAEKISSYLKNKNIQVTLKKIGEIKRAKDILFADVILIGSATHFGYMDWQTKRFFDETLYPLYIHRKTKLSDKYIGCFTTTKGGGGERCIKSIQHVLSDYGSKELPSLIIRTKASQDDVEKKIAKFTRKLIVKLQNAYGN